MKPIIVARLGHSGAPPLGGEPGIHSPRPVVMDSGLAASDLGFTRDRHYTMRTSATADVRRRPRNDAANDSNFEIAQLGLAICGWLGLWRCSASVSHMWRQACLSPVCTIP